jgi:membrane-bound metal-dependent hydrolase YbcI (DUF457 family)
MLLKTIAVWLLIAAGEVLNGNLRVRYLQRKFGRHRGKQISFFSGVLIFYLIAWLCLPWIGPQTIAECLVVGLVWVCLMTLLDIYFGRFVFRYSWQKVIDDFNPKKGNLLGVGMVLLLFCPTLVYLLK